MTTKELLHYKTGRIFSELEPRTKLYYEVNTMISIILLTKKLNKLKGCLFVRKPFELFNNVLFNYSEKRLESLLKHKAFRIIYKHFVLKGGLDHVKETVPTISQNKEVF